MVSPASGAQLLEREQELALLRAAWRSATMHHGSAWLVCAEAGGGKTRLLREASRGLPSRWGTSEPVTPPEPYLAVMQALRGFRPAPRRSESVTRAVELAERLSADQPLVIVLDDLHFADEGTLAVFVRLARLCADRPWLIFGAFRPGEGSEALRLAAAELTGQEQARRIDLPSLSRAAVGSLAAELRGHAIDDAELTELFAGSGGNPWFVRALALGAGSVAATRDRILLRLDRLEEAIPGARQLLAACAPAGEPLPHAVVAALAGGDTAELRQRLRGLRDAGVLREMGGAWQFRHELLRRSVLDDVVDAERRDAHRRLAEALESHASTAVVAMHYAEAGDARAATWALRAAREASAYDAHAEALAQIHRALGFPLDPEERRTALRAAARLTWSLGRFAESGRYAEQAIAIPGGEPETISWLHLRAGESWRLHGDGAAASAHLEAAERVLEGRPVSQQKLRVAVSLVQQAVMRGWPERAHSTAEQALALARDFDDRRSAEGYALEARCYVGLSRVTAGDPDGLSPFEGMLEIATARPETSRNIVRMAVLAYCAAVRALLHAEAERFRRWMVERMERHRFEWDAEVAPYRLLELVQRGAYTEARALEEQASHLAPRGHLVVETARALLHARLGAQTRAKALLETADPRAGFVNRALLSLARLDLHAGPDGSAPEQEAAEYYAFAERHGHARLAGVAAVALARATGRAPSQPDWVVARSPLQALWDWAGGLVANDAGRLRDAAQRLQQLDCPYEAAIALADAGDLQESYRALRNLGATHAQEMVARRLRAAGSSIPRGRSGGAPDSLTDTERAICRRLAAGATNGAIATELHIAVRTVEAHLNRIYQKTGRQGRAALASWWAEQMLDAATLVDARTPS
ncbi:MAG TPA: LuxR C-terminal-related transcriptional regulator [Dehalococcoidia bacterium]